MPPVVTIRGCAIGQGRPKTIIPLAGQSAGELEALAARYRALPADFVEWRADSFAGCTDAAALAGCLRRLRAALGPKPLLVTCRTAAEGGALALDAGQYAAFCRTVCQSGCADLLDIEYLPPGPGLPALIGMAHSFGLPVICSSHDFAATPPQAEMVARMAAMQQAGADIAKLAVMPHSSADVLALLAATAEMAARHPATPVVTMSMGPLGAVSRLAGEAFGSAMTFASAGQSSAPGQLELAFVNQALDALRL